MPTVIFSDFFQWFTGVSYRKEREASRKSREKIQRLSGRNTASMFPLISSIFLLEPARPSWTGYENMITIRRTMVLSISEIIYREKPDKRRRRKNSLTFLQWLMITMKIIIGVVENIFAFFIKVSDLCRFLLLDDKKIPLFSNSRQIIVGSSTAPQMFQNQQSKTGVEHQNYMTKCIRNEHLSTIQLYFL